MPTLKSRSDVAAKTHKKSHFSILGDEMQSEYRRTLHTVTFLVTNVSRALQYLSLDPNWDSDPRYIYKWKTKKEN